MLKKRNIKLFDEIVLQEQEQFKIEYSSDLNDNPTFPDQEPQGKFRISEDLTLRFLDIPQISLILFHQDDGSVERSIAINSIDPEDSTNQDFYFAENGQKIAGKRNRIKDKSPFAIMKNDIPDQIDFERTWESVLDVASKGFPKKFTSNNFSDLIVKSLKTMPR